MAHWCTKYSNLINNEKFPYSNVFGIPMVSYEILLSKVYMTFSCLFRPFMVKVPLLLHQISFQAGNLNCHHAHVKMLTGLLLCNESPVSGLYAGKKDKNKVGLQVMTGTNLFLGSFRISTNKIKIKHLYSLVRFVCSSHLFNTDYFPLTACLLFIT